MKYSFRNTIFYFKIIQRLFSKSNKETLSIPPFIYIVVNRDCNLKCKICDIGLEQRDGNLYKNLKKGFGDMEFEDLRKIIDQFKGSNVMITFHSTEPLLYPHIIDAVKYVKKNRLICKIATNGFLLPKFAEDLVRVGLDLLTVSIDGPEKIHDKIRGVKGSYKRIIRGLQEIQEYRKNRNSPSIRVNTTINSYNYHSLVEMIDKLKGIEIERFHLSHLNFVTPKMMEEQNKNFPIYPTRIKSSLSPESIDTEILYDQLTKIRTNYRHLGILESPKLTRRQLEIYYKYPNQNLDIARKCKFPWSASQILVNGDVVPIMSCMDILLGNVFKQNFKDIWNGQKYIMLRKYLNKYKYFPACKRCCGIFPTTTIPHEFREKSRKIRSDITATLRNLT